MPRFFIALVLPRPLQGLFAIQPLEPLGASVEGIDLAKQQPLSSAAGDQIRNALRQYGLLYFKHQDGLSPSGLFEFATVFCNSTSLWDPKRSPQFTGAGDGGQPGFPMVRALGNQDGSVLARLGYEWHVDSSDLTMLYSVEALESGGETLFVSAHHLYEALSHEQRARAEGLRIHYSNRYTGGGPAAVDAEHGLRMSPTGTRIARAAATRKANWKLSDSLEVPAVFQFAAQKRLILSPKNIDSCTGLSHNESHTLVENLLLAGLEPLFISRVDADLSPLERTIFSPAVFEQKWQSGDLVLWDNRAVLHSTTPIALYRGQRKMLQLMFSGELMGGTDEGPGMIMNARGHLNTGKEDL